MGRVLSEKDIHTAWCGRVMCCTPQFLPSYYLPPIQFQVTEKRLRRQSPDRPSKFASAGQGTQLSATGVVLRPHGFEYTWLQGSIRRTVAIR